MGKYIVESSEEKRFLVSEGTVHPSVGEHHSCVGIDSYAEGSWRQGKTLGRSVHFVTTVCLGPWCCRPNQGPGEGGSSKESKDLDKAANPIWRGRWEAKCPLSD